MSTRPAVELHELPSAGSTVVLQVRGALDAESSRGLLARGSEIQVEGRSLVLDLSGVTFLGSGGIGALLVLTEQFQEQATDIRFAALSPEAQSVVKLLNLDRFLAIHATVEDAVAKIAA